MAVIRYYQRAQHLPNHEYHKVQNIKSKLKDLINVEVEYCFYIDIDNHVNLADEDLIKLEWLLLGSLEKGDLSKSNFLNEKNHSKLIEIGPRLNFSTPFSSNVMSICKTINLNGIKRFEKSTRYLLHFSNNQVSNTQAIDLITTELCDHMTEIVYKMPLESFEIQSNKENWYEVDVLKRGIEAMAEVNEKLGLAFDKCDLENYTNMFIKSKRNPTTVECFDLAQSNSEHSRHWFFKGQLVINGEPIKTSLFDMIIDTQNFSNNNNVIKFSDNSSAIKGFSVKNFKPIESTGPSPFIAVQSNLHLVFTAETHNFPTGVEPFSGAATGTGGRIRDVQAVGRGGFCIASSAAYCVGNLYIPGYDLPWEDKSFVYPSNFAKPLKILIDASNGASDYGNKFGEPIICGFVRSFGMVINDERREWIKPIMFTGGLGTMLAEYTKKLAPCKGLQVVKIGGPVYRIGLGGSSASSFEVQGVNKVDLEFEAVQRGDPEMEQKMNRVIRACMENSSHNPILSIHDQGAGGNGNVLKEIVEPAGAIIYANKFELGDPTINALELWGAEYQENNAILCDEKDIKLLKKISLREKCSVLPVGVVTGDGKVILAEDEKSVFQNGKYPVNLDLSMISNEVPRKVFKQKWQSSTKSPIKLPKITVIEALDKVLRLPSVASKRYLTNKVDRSVTGKIAQQQCVGPLHTPLSDMAVTVVSLLDTVGIATSIGEQPIKGLINSAVGARMAVAESLTNLVFAPISCLEDVKCSGNWMWPAKLPGEGAELFYACKAMCDVMKLLGIAVDGGKDSLSMAAKVGNNNVKGPGSIVISTYAPCSDVRLVVTPDLKGPRQNLINKTESSLIFIDLSGGNKRLGGSALAQCYGQLGDIAPDLDYPNMLKNAFQDIQKLIKSKKLLSGHDISDGGLITCVLEMAFAGFSGFQIDLNKIKNTINVNDIDILFAEECGWIVEVENQFVEEVLSIIRVPAYVIGHTSTYGNESRVIIKNNKQIILDQKLIYLFKMWENTSFELEKLQSNKHTAKQEYDILSNRLGSVYSSNFIISHSNKLPSASPKVAVLREEGTNGDREMSAAFFIAGFEVWDITVQDLINNAVNIDQFRGLIFPGGFSYGDVLGSAKGWAASLTFNANAKKSLEHFIAKKNTFSLGVCNGCQLMCSLGLVGDINASNSLNIESPSVVLAPNKSGRFESRFSSVKINPSNALMLKNMEGSILGVWVAHAEGRFQFQNKNIAESLIMNNCTPITYVDDEYLPTEQYPMNPNGTFGGIASICSTDGRHLAIMPHPERSIFTWQWPYTFGLNLSEEHNYAPWMQMFFNAYKWCLEN
ncbi:phosphoribosylformylglycinamidine synthase [Adelges cooleyi]|uniref:phosphoribosylformylglycinamidine synthase n=1 Tax=Adelges cooleyi TaxID=133065 RepID=UPI0021802CFF|nr:phosphoribosylformylglycinamidine synthase [Adelges cooleyi]